MRLSVREFRQTFLATKKDMVSFVLILLIPLIIFGIIGAIGIVLSIDALVAFLYYGMAWGIIFVVICFKYWCGISG